MDGHNPAIKRNWAIDKCTPAHFSRLCEGQPSHLLAGLNASAERYCNDVAWVGLVRGRPVMAAGILIHWEGVDASGAPVGFGECWAHVATTGTGVPRRLWPEITLRSKTEIDLCLSTRLTLIECTVIADFVQGHTWARRLGFQRSGDRPRWSPDDQDGVLYNRVRGI